MPDNIKRRFFLLAGVLELADREFQAISEDIDKYAESVGELTQNGKLDEVPINSTSVIEYMLIKFNGVVLDENYNYIDEKIIDELVKFGLKI